MTEGAGEEEEEDEAQLTELPALGLREALVMSFCRFCLLPWYADAPFGSSLSATLKPPPLFTGFKSTEADTLLTLTSVGFDIAPETGALGGGKIPFKPRTPGPRFLEEEEGKIASFVEPFISLSESDSSSSVSPRVSAS